MKRDLGRLTGREHDVVVIGGGISGAAVAWDAAERGLRVALLEARDFGSGTSWNSLKTIHGGLRHLQRGDLASHRASTRERSALLRIAPKLVKPLPFLVPVYGHGALGREAFWAGLRIHDLLGRGRNHRLSRDLWIPRSRMLSPQEVLERVPGIEERGLSGGALWYDAQVESSERLVVAFLHEAWQHGAVLCNYVEAVGFLLAGSRVRGLIARDVETGDTMEVAARMIVNATGPGMDRMLQMAGIHRAPVGLLRAINLMLGRPILRDAAIGSRRGGRYLFLVPWRDRTIVGTDYMPMDGQGSSSTSGAREFLAEASLAYPWAQIDEDAVVLVHQGLVPRHAAGGVLTRHLVLDHADKDGLSGLLSVLAVKYTTARGVGEEVVDRVFTHLGRTSPPCRTADTELGFARVLEGPLAERARHAVREEMAIHLTDAILRRLDLGTGGAPSRTEIDAVASAMASEGGWDEGRTQRERQALSEELRRFRAEAMAAGER